jgi:hypothetical protein
LAAASLFYLDAGRDGEASDSEAYQLPLAATETADWVPHEDYFSEILRAQAGATEALTGAKLATDGSAVARLDSQVRLATVRGVFATGSFFEIVLGFHLQFLSSSGRSGRLKSFSGGRRGVLDVRGARIGCTEGRAGDLESREWRSRRSFCSLRSCLESTPVGAPSMVRASCGS